jgi:hypothetical protein
MIAGATEMAIVRRSLLFAMGRANAAIHVENDHLRRATVMNTVNPNPVHAGQDLNVCIARKKLRLEPPHLAGGRGLSFDSLAADNLPHGGITSKTLGVVHILITANTSKQRLAELTCHAVPSILGGTAVLENIPGNLGQAKGIIKLSISEKPPLELILEPWNSSFRRRSKSTRKGDFLLSPAG